MNWPQKKIGDFLTESSVEATSPSVERRIRVRLNAEGVEKRPLIAETEGATRYFRRKAGQFIYGKQNLHKGAFGVVPLALDGFESSSDLPAFDVADGLRPEWLVYFLKQGNTYKALASIARGAATKRIQPEALFEVKLPIPPIALQDEIIKRMDECVHAHSKLEQEIAQQEHLLTKLKQAILQEAIQGRLTAEWRAAHPEVEPARQLLQRIQAEKARLIAAKKLRPEKPLPNISPDEIPFEIPNGWEWCRMGDLINIKSGKRIHVSDYTEFGVPFLRSGEVGALGRGATIKMPLYISRQKYNEIKARFGIPKPDDILIACIGGSIGNTWVVDEREFYYKDGNLVLLESNDQIVTKFLLCYLSSPYFWDNTILNATDSSYNALTIVKLNHALFPLPPLAEQAAIVERVEGLMATCRALEAEIEHARTHAAHLLQAVLKEAFAPAAA